MAKTMITPIIKYNLKQRMRQFNGKERNFNIPELVKAINSDKVQERVKLGDLNGYYGHKARVLFGTEPQEGGLINGQMVYLEPCCRTIYLKAFPDGTVEHQQELYDNELGRKAWNLLQQKCGGFSSVISAKNGYDFHGFDLVFEPNFSKNRPYDYLDSVEHLNESDLLVIDDVGELDRRQLHYACLLDSIDIYQQTNAALVAENQLLTTALANLKQEHDVLLDDIVVYQEKLEAKQQSIAQQRQFDALTLDNVVAQANRFKQAKLEKTEDVVALDEAQQQHRQVEQFMRRWGF